MTVGDFFANVDMAKKIFIGGLTVKTTADELAEYFKQFGEVVETMVILDRNGISKQFGYIMYKNEEGAKKVFDKKDNLFLTKQLEVRECERPTGRYRKCPPRFADIWKCNAGSDEIVKYTPAPKKYQHKKCKKSPSTGAMSTRENTPEDDIDTSTKKSKIKSRALMEPIGISFEAPVIEQNNLETRIRSIDWEAVELASKQYYDVNMKSEWQLWQWNNWYQQQQYEMQQSWLYMMGNYVPSFYEYDEYDVMPGDVPSVPYYPEDETFYSVG